MSGPYTFVWDHGVTEDQLASFVIEHNEGDIATLNVTIKNPRIGLLSGTLTATLSDASGAIFAGRLIGVPSGIQADAITLTFLGCGSDIAADKELAAATMRADREFYDPAFIPPEQRLDPDVCLEARSQLWHVHRVNHSVGTTDIILGENALNIDADAIVYDSVQVDIGEPPAFSANVKGKVSWRQKAKGEIDLTALMMTRLGEGGFIRTLSGEGLVGDWPKPGTRLGGGWSVSKASILRHEELTTIHSVTTSTGGFGSEDSLKTGFTGPFAPYPVINVVYGGGLEDWGDGTFTTSGSPDNGLYTFEISLGGFGGKSFVWPNYYPANASDAGHSTTAGFPIWWLTATLAVQYEADREIIETTDFDIGCAVQDVTTDRGDRNVYIDLTSGEVDQFIDDLPPYGTAVAGPNGKYMPIGDTMHSTYFGTPRGLISLRYLANLATSKLVARARAVHISFTTTFNTGRNVDPSYSVSFADPRLLNSTVQGKVSRIALSFDAASGRAASDITIACCVGEGGSVWGGVDPVDTTFDPLYVDSGYVEDDYQTASVAATSTYGVQLTVTPPTPDPDAIDFTNISSKGIKGLRWIHKISEQIAALGGGDTNAIKANLDTVPTQLELKLLPVAGVPAMETEIAVTATSAAPPLGIQL